MAPVRGHLAATGGGVVFGADGLQESFQRGDAKHQAESAVAVVRVEPIDAGTKKEAHGGGDGFVAGAGNLEENFILALELNFAVGEWTGEKLRSVGLDEWFAVEAVKPAGVEFGYFYARLYCHSGGPLDARRWLAVG